MSKMTYITLIDRLGTHQFPDEEELPDSDGFFSRPRPFSEENPLKLHHCEITARQVALLQGDATNTDLIERESTEIAQHTHTMTDTLTQTLTEVDMSYELDMELRSDGQLHTDSQPLDTVTSSSQHISTYIPARNEVEQTQVDSQEEDAVTRTVPLAEELPYSLCTQNATQESIENIEKWLTHSTSVVPDSKLFTVHEKETGAGKNRDDYSVSSDSDQESSRDGLYGRGKLRSGRVRYAEKASDAPPARAPERKIQEVIIVEEEVLTQPQVLYVDSDEEKGPEESSNVDSGSSSDTGRKATDRKRRHRQDDASSESTVHFSNKRSRREETVPPSTQTDPTSSSSFEIPLTSTATAIGDAKGGKSKACNKLIGHGVHKKFTGYGWFKGKVTSYSR